MAAHSKLDEFKALVGSWVMQVDDRNEFTRRQAVFKLVLLNQTAFSQPKLDQLVSLITNISINDEWKLGCLDTTFDPITFSIEEIQNRKMMSMAFHPITFSTEDIERQGIARQEIERREIEYISPMLG